MHRSVSFVLCLLALSSASLSSAQQASNTSVPDTINQQGQMQVDRNAREPGPLT